MLGFADSGLLSGMTYKHAAVGACKFAVAFSDI